MLINQIDKIYSGSSSNSLYDYRDLKGNTSNFSISRYKTYDIKYSPYIINPELIKKLSNQINVCCRSYNIKVDITNYNEIIINSSNKLIIYEPNNMTNLDHEHQITPLGLLALRLGRTYGNTKLIAARNDLLDYYVKYNDIYITRELVYTSYIDYLNSIKEKYDKTLYFNFLFNYEFGNVYIPRD